MITRVLHVLPHVAACLGLGEPELFEQLMTLPIGTLLADEVDQNRSLWRIGAGPAALYLKRAGGESMQRHLRMLVTGHLPVSGAMREKILLDNLQAAGFATMTPVAWGEERFLGIPRRSFLIVEHVEGDEFTARYAAGTVRERRELAYALGQLMGRLHAAGFFQTVRFKDVICRGDELVLIDRECSNCYTRPFTKVGCVVALARAFRRTVREDNRIGPGTSTAFLNGYSEGVAPKWDVDLPALRCLVYDKLKRKR